eukprot:Em0162g17a
MPTRRIGGVGVDGQVPDHGQWVWMARCLTIGQWEVCVDTPAAEGKGHLERRTDEQTESNQALRAKQGECKILQDVLSEKDALIEELQMQQATLQTVIESLQSELEDKQLTIRKLDNQMQASPAPLGRQHPVRQCGVTRVCLSGGNASLTDSTSVNRVRLLLPLLRQTQLFLSHFAMVVLNPSLRLANASSSLAATTGPTTAPACQHQSVWDTWYLLGGDGVLANHKRAYAVYMPELVLKVVAADEGREGARGACGRRCRKCPLGCPGALVIRGYLFVCGWEGRDWAARKEIYVHLARHSCTSTLVRNKTVVVIGGAQGGVQTSSHIEQGTLTLPTER